MSPPPYVGCLWERMRMSRRRFILSAVIAGIGLIVAATVWLALDFLTHGDTGDGVLFPPLVLLGVVHSALIGASVLLVVQAADADAELQAQARLGNVWVLASMALMFDFLTTASQGSS